MIMSREKWVKYARWYILNNHVFTAIQRAISVVCLYNKMKYIYIYNYKNENIIQLKICTIKEIFYLLFTMKMKMIARNLYNFLRFVSVIVSNFFETL